MSYGRVRVLHTSHASAKGGQRRRTPELASGARPRLPCLKSCYSLQNYVGNECCSCPLTRYAEPKPGSGSIVTLLLILHDCNLTIISFLLSYYGLLHLLLHYHYIYYGNLFIIICYNIITEHYICYYIIIICDCCNTVPGPIIA